MMERFFHGVGIGLLALCFGMSLGRIAISGLAGGGGEEKRVTLRVAHWQLENGVREALDAIGREYEKVRPGVKVVQIPIPERIYGNWLITQLVGETAPDVIQVGIGVTDERLARYFEPLGELANSPNPYNAGTELEGVPLRDTMFDGMLGGFNAGLLEYYSVPISGHSVRMFYNLDFLREITGGEELPETFDELMALCAKAKEYAEGSGRPFIPIAGSKYNAPFMMDALFSSQMQVLAEDLNPPGFVGGEPVLRARQYLRGEWGLRVPGYRSGLSLMREVGQQMQPGFIQLGRDDAMFLFVQGRSLMMASGSWDATSIRGLAGFRLGIGRVPLPSREHPRYGRFTHGSLSEAGHTASVGFGLTRGSGNGEVARDFLRFLASRRISQLWADTSGWLPSVTGVKANADVAPFLPVVEGALGGLFPAIERGHALPEVGMLVENHLHLLVGAAGGVDAYLDAVEPGYRAALCKSLERRAREREAAAMNADSQFAALAWLSVSGEGDAEDARKWELARQSLGATDRARGLLRVMLEEGKGGR